MATTKEQNLAKSQDASKGRRSVADSSKKDRKAAFSRARRRLWLKFAKWCDEWKIGAEGILLASRNKKFVVATIATFLVFGTIMSLLSSSTAALGLFWQVDLGGKLKIIGSGFLAIFGVGRSFWDWLLVFSVTVIQSLLIGLIAMVWRKKRRNKKQQLQNIAANSDNLQNASLAAGLAVLGSGCPTCGTTLLMPLLGSLFSTSSFALAGIVSGLLTAASIIIALLALKKVGNDVYAMIISERRKNNHGK